MHFGISLIFAITLVELNIIEILCLHTRDIVDEDHDKTLKKIKKINSDDITFYREEIMIFRNLVFLRGLQKPQAKNTFSALRTLSPISSHYCCR